jgi:hypothetical protein
MNCRIWIASLVALVVSGVNSLTFAAPITYVDAKSGAGGNTALAAGGVFTPPLNGTTGLDNQWEERTALGNGTNIFESQGEGPAVGENAPRLVTTVTGLTPGQTYRLHAFFWSPNDINQSWMLRAGLSNPGGDLPSWGRLNNDAGTNPSGLVAADGDSFPITPDTFAPYPALGPADFANPGALLAGTTMQGNKTVIVESSRFLWDANLGLAVADSNGEARVFIDDYVLTGGAPPAGPQTVNNRTWYDGVGYELVPEPSTATMLLVTGIALAARRRG